MLNNWSKLKLGKLLRSQSSIRQLNSNEEKLNVIYNQYNYSTRPVYQNIFDRFSKKLQKERAALRCVHVLALIFCLICYRS